MGVVPGARGKRSRAPVARESDCAFGLAKGGGDSCDIRNRAGERKEFSMKVLDSLVEMVRVVHPLSVAWMRAMTSAGSCRTRPASKRRKCPGSRHQESVAPS